ASTRSVAPSRVASSVRAFVYARLRKIDLDRETSKLRAAVPNRIGVLVGDRCNDRQAEPGPTGIATARLVEPAKTFSELREIGVRDARTSILDAENDAAVRCAHVDVNRRGRLGVAARVRDEVDDDLLETCRVSVHARRYGGERHRRRVGNCVE